MMPFLKRPLRGPSIPPAAILTKHSVDSKRFFGDAFMGVRQWRLETIILSTDGTSSDKQDK